MKDGDSRNGILRAAPRPTAGRNGMTPGLTALGTAAVVGIYAAGFTLTRDAAHGLDGPRGDPSRETELAVDGGLGTGMVGGGSEGDGDVAGTSEGREGATARNDGTGVPTSADYVAGGEGASSVTGTSSPGGVPTASSAGGSADPARAPSTGLSGSSEASATSAPIAAPASAPVRERQALASSGADRPASPPAPTSGSAAADAPASTGAPTPAATSAASASASSPAPAPESPYQDGLYTAWGIRTGHGTIEATVEISGGRIVSAVVSTCRMRWPCTDVDPMIPRMIRAQRPGVPVISGATQSSDAFSTAVTEALALARSAKAAQATPQ